MYRTINSHIKLLKTTTITIHYTRPSYALPPNRRRH